jgi:hypothetical protein
MLQNNFCLLKTLVVCFQAKPVLQRKIAKLPSETTGVQPAYKVVVTTLPIPKEAC